ncbi:MAG: hypothetical protein JRJ72_05255 [Deltaproteobacteria bacterium]|nr:hypothetical protein [Deltaproteobacteria bacterium]
MGDVEKTTDDNSLDWEKRRLCPDESCIGIIGLDGRCTECGRLADSVSDQEPPDASAHPAVDQRPEPSPAPSAAEAEETGELPEPVEDDDWQSRRLCPDESCIGIIGPDGRCTECGRREDDIP